MLTTHSSAPGSSGGAAGSSGQDPRFMPTEDAFTLPFLPRQGMEGFDRGYFLPAEVTAFWGIYYHESGDVRPGYTGASPWDFPLDCQGHMALKLHSAAYSSHIGLVLTGIVYPQQEDPAIKIDQYSYFNIIGTKPPPTNHGIWGCLHYLPLVSNVFLAQYDSGTFLSHLTDWGYGFDAIGSPGIDMCQMYIIGGMHYIRVGLNYKPHGLIAGNIKRCATFLRTFFDRCESEIDVAPSQTYFLQKRGVWGLSVTACHLGFVLTPSFPALV